MVRLNPLYLCAWHLIRLNIYRTNLQSNSKVISKPEWVSDIIATTHCRIKLPFQLISVVLVYGCLETTTSLSYAIFGSIAWWFMLSFLTSKISKTTGHVDIVICCCSLLLYWLRSGDWNRSRPPVVNTIEYQALSFVSVMICGVMLMDLCMDSFAFNRILVTDTLVRVSRYYTLIFQIHINYFAYVLLALQPLIAIYGYLFVSLPFVVMSFGIVFMVCLVLATVWNVVVVKIFQYSKVEMLVPGTQRRLPDTFDYLLPYQLLTPIHCTMLIALIATVTVI